jgi:UDP-glucose 4-epimerase
MILITGGAGYIGSHAVMNFLNNGYEVVIFDNLENGHIETVETLKKIGKLHFVKGDLKNLQDIENVFQDYKIDTVIHFAGYIQVEESVQNPSKYYRNNIIGSLNLFDTMIKYNVKKIVFSSTCAIYGEPKYTPLDENHPKNPLNPYGKTKLIIEEILNDYDVAYGLKFIILRYFNVVGADSQTRIGEWHNPETHLIPNILKSVFEKDKTFKIFGTDYDTKDGTCIRDYVNIEDMAEAHRLAYLYLNKYNKSDVFNIGTQQGNSVKEVFDIAKQVVGKDIQVEYKEKRLGDAAILFANASKAKSVLNWEGKKSLKDSIETAYLWEKSRNNK